MNDDLLKKVALLQIKEKVMKDSGDVLTDLADMQALRQFSADLKELIDEQHAAGAIPADPMASLRERLMKVVDAIKNLQTWQKKQSETLSPFLKENPKVSLGEINAMLKTLSPLAKEEAERIEQVTSSCDSNEWYVKGNVIHLRSELEAVQEALLPEFSKYCNGNKGCTLKVALGSEKKYHLERLATQNKEQAAAAAEIESLLQQGNYRTAKTKAEEAKLLTAKGKIQAGFTDIDFADQAAEITKCDETLKKIKSHLASNVTSTQDKGNAAADLHNAETMLNDAQGELREDLSAGVTRLKAHIAKAKKNAKTKLIKVACLAALGIALVVFSLMKIQAFREARIALQLKLDEPMAEAVASGDMQAIKSMAEKIIPDRQKPSDYTGWAKKSYPNGDLREICRYQNGKENGVNIIWWGNGNKWMEINYKDGKENGLFTTWHENGMKEKESHFVDGEKHGLETEWDYFDGYKEGERHYENGKKHGLEIGWWDNGQKSHEKTYVEGIENGPTTGWHKNGNLRWRGTYKNDKLHGKYSEYFESDGGHYSDTYYVNGERQ